ncbi:MAG: ribonuclease H-like domain-containing protein [Aquificaceae bacterium]
MKRTAVLDIETFCPKEEILEIDLSYLKNRRDYQSEEDFSRDLATNPYVACLISFALFFLEEDRAEVYYLSEKSLEEVGGSEYKVKVLYKSISLKDGLLEAEKKLIEIFWGKLAQIGKLITFHGKDFDINFVKIRTMIHELKPKNFFLMANHIDLKDVFAVGRRNYTLDFIARRMGILLDKGNMDGSKVDGLFKNKEYKKIAEYNLRDVLITGMLYQKIKGYITIQDPEVAGSLLKALDENRLSSREVSDLIDLLLGQENPPTHKQKKYLQSLLQQQLSPPLDEEIT